MNISTIAQLANVSKSTVSRVLSKNGSVSKEAYQRVMKVVQETGYRPNQYARILNKKSTNLIGIIAPDITNPYFPQIIQCIGEVATTSGYRVILCTADTKSENEYLDMLEDMHVDGTILLCPTTDLSDLTRFERQQFVSVDAVINDTVPFVCSDFYKGGFIAATKLVENGCKKILHISGHDYYYANIQRQHGFNMGVKQYENSNVQAILLSGVSNSTAYDIIKRFLLNNPAIDGVFAGNDSIAFIVLRILNELNIHIPESMKVIGYDDNYMIPMVYPLLSTIKQPISDIGKTAVTTLINMIHNQQVTRENILNVDYIKRNTTIC